MEKTRTDSQPGGRNGFLHSSSLENTLQCPKILGHFLILFRHFSRAAKTLGDLILMVRSAHGLVEELLNLMHGPEFPDQGEAEQNIEGLFEVQIAPEMTVVLDSGCIRSCMVFDSSCSICFDIPFSQTSTFFQLKYFLPANPRG